MIQLSDVKLESIEKNGKIQTTKMTNSNICSTKREPNKWKLLKKRFWSSKMGWKVYKLCVGYNGVRTVIEI